ncbi:hypothetical protein F4780DRAFT_762290 [Xylariomycetidae sp. FL0641]|nr:hypothetical protein F4780DRAFT_762290 [Xylariomycetidae sp. FL0641]
MEDTGRQISPLQSLTLDLPPSCIEFCPAHPDYFVIGTYNLQKEESSADTGTASEQDLDDDGEEHQPATATKKTQSRNGSLVVFRLSETKTISHVQTVSYPSALLDLHFHLSPDKNDVMATVSSTGSLSFFQFTPPVTSPGPLKELATHKPLGEDDSVLLLSCAWHPELHDLLAITTSDYQVHVLRIDGSWGAREMASAPVLTHMLEAWTVAFSPYLELPEPETNNPDAEDTRIFTIYSGGDDSKLLATSCSYHKDRADEEEDAVEVTSPTTAFRGHEAGVTAILPLALKLADGASIVITGSYDDHLRVYAVHSTGGFMLRPPRILADINLGGGVWRLKLVELEVTQEEGSSETNGWVALVLASCMHAGARVLEISGDNDDNCQVKVLGRFEEHKSMNYGSDFWPGKQERGEVMHYVSTSFYDKLLCLWEF